MNLNKIATIDFETKAIFRRPKYPPKPVGVAVKLGSQKSRYYSWGHPSNNNCTENEAKEVLFNVWQNYELLFHNAKFDLEVLAHFIDISICKTVYHDSMILAFLHEPNDKALGLKQLADDYLSMPPDEQEEMKDWLWENRRDITKGKSRSWKQFGAYISEIPGDIVGEYAIGDVDRTFRLFKLFYKNIKSRDMLEAYKRELYLIPVMIEAERGGICVDVELLKSELKKAERELSRMDTWLGKHLNVESVYDVQNKSFVDAGESLADSLERGNYIDQWILTKTGRRSTAKDNIEKCINDQRIINFLRHRSQLANNIRNFMRPWLSMSENTGRIYTNWNTTKNDNGKGARTGRFSSNPNFQNPPKKVERPKKMPKGFRAKQLCNMRNFIVADSEDHVLIDRDYSQQELRVMAHYENGAAQRAFNEDPKMDFHDFATELVNHVLGSNFDRKPIKTMGFGLVYGMGVKLLSDKMEVDLKTGKKLKQSYLSIFPDLKALDDKLKAIGRAGDSLRTWGGREYYCEDPKGGKTFEYKMLNTLIQGSSADCTKEAILNTFSRNQFNKGGFRFLLSVHDEILCSVHKDCAVEAMQHLKQNMESVKFNVPMLSDGKIGYRWGELEGFEDEM